MKIVVIDDEPVIAGGIAKMAEGINPQWEVIGIYSDAQEALELCNWDEVQVVLTDISMPHLDGLEFLKILKERGYNVFVILITAYAKFEYAKAAVQSQALDYLLKPVVRKDLESALNKAEQQWKKRLERESDAAYISENLRHLRKYFFSDLIFEERLYTPQQMEQGLQRYRLWGKRYLIAAFFSSEESNLLKNRLREKELTSENAAWLLYGQKPFYILLLVIDEISAPDSYYEVLRDNSKALCFSESIASVAVLSEQYRLLLHQLRQAIETSVRTYDFVLEDPLADKEFPIIISQTLRYIHSNYNKKLTLKNISEKVYLHPTYLSNTFKKQTGFTVMDYINYYRIMQAKRMLKNPNSKIYWVMEQVGFVNERYFSEVFKKVTNMTPTQYKQNVYFEDAEAEQTKV